MAVAEGKELSKDSKRTKKGSFAELGKIEREWFKADVIEMYLQAFSRNDIKIKMMEEYLLTDETSVENAIDRARREFFTVERVEEGIASKKEEYIANYKYLLNIAAVKAKETGNTKNAKDVLDSMVKLEGLLIEKQEVKVVDGFEVTF